MILLGQTVPVQADLKRAQLYFDQARYQEAYREALAHRKQDPKRSELLQIWALSNLLRGDEALTRLRAFRPDPGCARLYLLVHASLEPESRLKDLEQALELCTTPAERVDILLRLFRANPFPKDQPYWQEAAEIAAQHRLPTDLLARLSLAHVNLLSNLKRPQEGFLDLATADALLKGDPSRAWRVEQARIELLNALGRGTEARAARLALPRLAPDKLRALFILMNLAEARSEVTGEQGRRLLEMLPVVSEPHQRLYAFRIRSLVLQNSGHGLEEWRRQADALCRSSSADERLIGFSERGITLAARFQPQDALGDLLAARALAGGHQGSELFSLAQPAPLSLALAQVELSLQHYAQAEKWARQALEEAGQDFNLFLSSGLCLLSIDLRTAQLDAANQLLDRILQRAETLEAPLPRALAYFQLLSTLVMSSLESNRSLSEYTAMRVDADTPAGWLFARIRQDAKLQARIFKALDDLKQQSAHPALRGVEGLFRGWVLGSLDRPLEAIDVYTESLEHSDGYSPLVATTGLMLSQELWGAGQRQQAVPVLQKALKLAEAGSPFVPIGRYRVALAKQLLLLERRQEALELLEMSLRDPKDELRPVYLVLRGHALGNAADLRQALEAARQENTRTEACLALHEIEPTGGWLERISDRSPKLSVRLMAASSPERALEIGHESLEQFREIFEQLPTAARPHALQSPGLQALIQAILEASLAANKPQEGAHCLAVWRALQSQPALVNPELEGLRAELTGLRSSIDPGAAARLADTRARFLLKSNELRQLNPDMEKSLSAQVSELLALQPHLDEKTLLVQYYLAPDGVYLQAVTREQQQLLKVSVEKTRLLQLLERWRSGLRSARPLSEEALAASHQLYTHLVQPITALRTGHPDLWVMPTGELWDLPFESLLDNNNHYLLESAGCAYLGPSEAMQMAQAAASPQGFWLGVSNQRLPGTLQEISRLKGLFEDARETQSWSELKGLAPQAGILHLATHSQAQPDRATESTVEMAEGPVPMEQIYGLTLPRGSLVVLSSCSGAAGQTHRERDLISLSSGFRAAGASSVIAALWPIDDEATAPFFVPMYQALQQRQSRLQALRAAKLAMLTQPAYAHPYFWSGFTLLGDGR